MNSTNHNTIAGINVATQANAGVRVYIVTEGMEGGYLPESVSYFSTKHAAHDYMADRKASALDEGYKVSGSLRDGLYILDDGRALNQYIELDESTLAGLGAESIDELNEAAF